MKIQFFSVDALEPEADQDIIDDFCARHPLVSVEKRFVERNDKVRAHVRYMDDTLFWCDSREEAKEKLAALREYLSTERQLQLKPDTRARMENKGTTVAARH